MYLHSRILAVVIKIYVAKFFMLYFNLHERKLSKQRLICILYCVSFFISSADWVFRAKLLKKKKKDSFSFRLNFLKFERYHRVSLKFFFIVKFISLSFLLFYTKLAYPTIWKYEYSSFYKMKLEYFETT